MSIPYLAMPLTADLFPWLREHGHSVDASATGRWPLLDELRAAAELPGHTVQIRQGDKGFELAIDPLKRQRFPAMASIRTRSRPALRLRRSHFFTCAAAAHWTVRFNV